MLVQEISHLQLLEPEVERQTVSAKVVVLVAEAGCQAKVGGQDLDPGHQVDLELLQQVDLGQTFPLLDLLDLQC